MTEITEKRVKHASNITMIASGVIVSLVSLYLAYLGRGALNYCGHIAKLPQTECNVENLKIKDSLKQIAIDNLRCRVKDDSLQSVKNFRDVKMGNSIIMNGIISIDKKLGIDPIYIPDELKSTSFQHGNVNKTNCSFVGSD